MFASVLLVAVCGSRSRGSAPLPRWKTCSRLPASTGVSFFRQADRARTAINGKNRLRRNMGKTGSAQCTTGRVPCNNQLAGQKR